MNKNRLNAETVETIFILRTIEQDSNKGGLKMRDKSAYVEKLEKKIEELDAQLHKLREKGRMAKRDAEIDVTMKLEELREKRDDLMEKLDGLKNASGQGWESLKEGLEKAYEDLKSAFHDAKSKFK